MRSLFKKFDTSGHFPDFKHTAKGQRDDKKIRAKKERRMLNKTDKTSISKKEDKKCWNCWNFQLQDYSTYYGFCMLDNEQVNCYTKACEKFE